MDPSVIAVRCRPVSRRVPQALDVRELPHCVAISNNCQHIWLDAGDGSFRLDVLEGSALEGPVEIEPAIMLARAIEPQLGSVERLAGHLQGCRLASAPDPRLARLTLALRTMDARAEGASLRSIAIGLLRNADWPGDGEWMKSWVRRIVKLASALKKAGPRGVLSHAI